MAPAWEPGAEDAAGNGLSSSGEPAGAADAVAGASALRDRVGAVGTESGAGVEVTRHVERLLIGRERRAVERVRITKRIVTTTRTIEVPVRVEQLVITHEPLSEDDPIPRSGQAAASSGARFGVDGESFPRFHAATEADGMPRSTEVDAEVDAGALPGDVVLLLHEEVPEVSVRVVPVERVTVAVRTVTGEQTVTADLASEHVEVLTSDLPTRT